MTAGKFPNLITSLRKTVDDHALSTRDRTSRTPFKTSSLTQNQENMISRPTSGRVSAATFPSPLSTTWACIAGRRRKLCYNGRDQGDHWPGYRCYRQHKYVYTHRWCYLHSAAAAARARGGVAAEVRRIEISCPLSSQRLIWLWGRWNGYGWSMPVLQYCLLMQLFGCGRQQRFCVDDNLLLRSGGEICRCGHSW